MQVFHKFLAEKNTSISVVCGLRDALWHDTVPNGTESLSDEALVAGTHKHFLASLQEG